MKKTIALLFILGCYGIAFTQTINTALSYSVNKPANVNSKTPVLILLHGYGSNEADLLQMSKSFDSRFITFSLRAPFIANNGFSWYDVEFLPGSQMRYDYKQIKNSREQVLAFISAACRAYKADSTQVFVLGFSQGAIMAYELAFTAPTKIKGIVALSGRMADESKEAIKDWENLRKVKIFIAHGRSDNVISYSDSEKAHAFLQSNKVADLTFKNYEMPHQISGNEQADIQAWLLKALGNTAKAPGIK